MHKAGVQLMELFANLTYLTTGFAEEKSVNFLGPLGKVCYMEYKQLNV